jgi:hypothetical protein
LARFAPYAGRFKRFIGVFSFVIKSFEHFGDIFILAGSRAKTRFSEPASL